MAHAAEDDGFGQGQVLAVGVEVVVDLDGQLSRGGEDEGADGFAVALCGQALQDGHAEGTGLARAGLGAAQDIPPGDTGGDGLFLDHGGRLVAILGQSGLNGRRDPKGCKGCHKTNSFLSCVPFPLGGALGFQGSSSRK